MTRHRTRPPASRKLARNGRPVRSSSTPKLRATCPCGQKSDSSGKPRSSACAQARSANMESHETPTTSTPSAPWATAAASSRASWPQTGEKATGKNTTSNGASALVSATGVPWASGSSMGATGAPGPSGVGSAATFANEQPDTVPVLAAFYRAAALQPRSARRVVDLGRGDMTGTTGLGRHDEDRATVVEIGLRLHDDVGQIVVVGVAFPPPDKRAINNIAVVFIDELGPC